MILAMDIIKSHKFREQLVIMDSESIRFLVPKKTLSSFCDIAEQKAKLSEFLLL